VAEEPLNSVQRQKLESMLRAGFRFLSIERYAGFLAVEKDNFVALLDPGQGGLKLFSQIGYLMGGGIGMLVEDRAGKAFVFHADRIPATPAMLAAYEAFRENLLQILAAE
jgi:hypothetical protein